MWFRLELSFPKWDAPTPAGQWDYLGGGGQKGKGALQEGPTMSLFAYKRLR
jgi:hypothetical protein